jgi:hypothetical protein
MLARQIRRITGTIRSYDARKFQPPAMLRGIRLLLLAVSIPAEWLPAEQMDQPNSTPMPLI